MQKGFVYDTCFQCVWKSFCRGRWMCLETFSSTYIWVCSCFVLCLSGWLLSGGRCLFAPQSLLPVVLQLCFCFLESLQPLPVSALLFVCLGCPCPHFQQDCRHSSQLGTVLPLQPPLKSCDWGDLEVEREAAGTSLGRAQVTPLQPASSLTCPG